MARILIVHGNAEWYGSDRSLVLLSAATRLRGCEVAVALPARGRLEAALREAGVPVHLVDSAPLRGRVLGARGLVRYALADLPLAAARVARLARHYDLVHVNTSILFGAVVGGAIARRPVVLHVRETYKGSERAWRAYARLVGPLVSRVVGVSEDVVTEARATAFGDRVVLVHNGLEFGPRPGGAEQGPLLAVGRINEWKGHDVLIEAVALLLSRGVEVAVEIAGDTYPGQEALLDELVQRASDLGVDHLVRFLGYVEDVDALMARAAVFVQPSTLPEPFGLSLAEALGNGLACIATNAGGPREMIRDGETGLLVPPGDAQALADAIETLWQDPALRRCLGDAAASDVRERFTIDSTAEKMAGLWEELLPGARR